MHFCQDVVSQAQRKIAKWMDHALSLTSMISPHDAVMQKALKILEILSHKFAVMAKILSPTLKNKHRRAIFEG